MRLQHVNIMVDDLDRADAFYTDVLGLARIPTPDLGMPAQFFRLGPEQELHVNQLDDRRPERAHFCLVVDDFNVLFDRVYRLGVVETETWGKVRRLPSGVMQLFVRDPAGNLIELSSAPHAELVPELAELDIVDRDTTFFRHPDSR